MTSSSRSSALVLLALLVPTCRPSGLETSVCGDERRASDEACDDGNVDDGDACTTSCESRCGEHDAIDVLLLLHHANDCGIMARIYDGLPGLVGGVASTGTDVRIRAAVVPAMPTLEHHFLECAPQECGHAAASCGDERASVVDLASADGLPTLQCLFGGTGASWLGSHAPWCAAWWALTHLYQETDEWAVLNPCLDPESPVLTGEFAGAGSIVAVIAVSASEDCSLLDLPNDSCANAGGLSCANCCDYQDGNEFALDPAPFIDLFATARGPEGFFLGGLIALDDSGSSAGPVLDENGEIRVLCKTSDGAPAMPAPRIERVVRSLPSTRHYLGNVCDESFEGHFYEMGRRLGYLTLPCPPRAPEPMSVAGGGGCAVRPPPAAAVRAALAAAAALLVLVVRRRRRSIR